MFSRRTIQRLLDELSNTLSQDALIELTARLNNPGMDRFAAIWEVSIMYALGYAGKIEYQPQLSNGRKPGYQTYRWGPGGSYIRKQT